MSCKERDPIERAVRDVSHLFGLTAEITRKHWPADGIIYVRLIAPAGADEWVLLEAGSDYEKVAEMLDRPAQRLKDGEARGL